MDTIVLWIGQLLGYIVRPCYWLTHSYGWAILLFVLISKFILLPVSIWVQKNGIKLVKMQPEINWLKVNYFGDHDTIAEKQSQIYKHHKYNAFASLIPLFIQLVILLGLVEVIYNPLRYIVSLPEDLISAMISLTQQLTGCDPTISSVQMLVVNAVKNEAFQPSFLALAAQFPSLDIPAIMASVKAINMAFCGIDLSWIPQEIGGITYIVPILAGLSAWIMCVTQNQAQVLQAEQGKLNQYGTMAISVALSLYLGFFVPAGIGLYWIASNLLSIVQMYLLNIAINPKNEVDYHALEESRAALHGLEASISSAEKKRSPFHRDPLSKREKADYKRFFSIANKHVVFYSEKSGFWKYYKDIVEALLSSSNIRIHYITNDPDDQIFKLAERESRISPYYIGPRRIITLMMKMDADIVVMTTPDLEAFQLKRSYIRKDIEYIYTPHDPMSIHLAFREGALDHFDTVFCVGPQQIREIRATEESYQLPAKTLVECGYCLLDDLRRSYQPSPASQKQVLIAPSWQEDNILDSCIDPMLESLLKTDCHITVRPHPEYVKRYGPKMDALISRWADKAGDQLQFETDFSSNSSIWNANVLITDWSGIAYEYSYTTLRPSLFINTKIKATNPNWERIGITPLDIALRDKIGVSVEKSDVPGISQTVSDLMAQQASWASRIQTVRDENIFNPGHCGATAAGYVLSRLVKPKSSAAALSSQL